MFSFLRLKNEHVKTKKVTALYRVWRILESEIVPEKVNLILIINGHQSNHKNNYIEICKQIIPK